ncbi:MAG TPA: hypothetical protein VG498_24425 [Terriglobales bacterium]|nr:hypothetical protein [Terriglobales bacterium]
MWLGPKRGHLTDWTTQIWVKTNGVKTDLKSSPWLEGPIAKPTGIGVRFFDDFAAEHGLSVQAGTGLIKNLAQLSGPGLRLEEITPEVRHFYENTSEYELDAWSEWCGFFRPFGYVLARVFSHRLQQLNVPLSSLDTSRGVTSRVADLADAEGNVRYTAWIRELLGSRHVLYAGSYSTCRVPEFDGCCVKVVFPLPNGNAIVIMYPRTDADGSLLLTSSGERFGSPGFYFTVHDRGLIWAKYVPAMRETIRVYTAAKNQVRADHVLRFQGLTFLRLHYRLQRTQTAQPQVAGQP